MRQLTSTQFNLFLLIIALIAATTFSVVNSKLNEIFYMVMEGEADLICVFSYGERKVNPDLIKYEVDGTWVFTNGHSKSCRIVKSGE